MNESISTQCFTYVAEILGLLRSTNQHERVLHLIVDRISRLIRCQTCAIVLIDEKTEYLRIDNFVGLSHTFCNDFRRHIATASIGRLLWTGTPVIVNGDEPDPTLVEEVRLEHPCASCVCLQIAVDHRTLGYLHIDSTEKYAFTEDDMRLLRLMADVAGLALNKSHLFEENLHLERIDKETMLEKYNPFLEKVDAAIERAAVLRERFCLLLLDVDNFKQIVKTYGYDASRQLLRQMADRVRSTLRPIDAAARYGFDEFVLLVENSSLEDGLALARNLLAAIERGKFTQHEIGSTVSIGVASYPDNGTTRDDLLLSAKQALFAAQSGGRNNVFAFKGEWYVKEEEVPSV
jgi:diguanylate cyclase (GGDEF)-like protein